MTFNPDLTISLQSPLQLLESPDENGHGLWNEDGTVNVVVIRPCDGRGPGGRIYTAPVLEKSAASFAGQPSYLNHRDPRAKNGAKMIRRGPDELAGELRECFWHPTYTEPDDAKHGYEPGAVVGRFMPANDLVESLIRRVPNQLKLSINGQATGIRPARRKDGTKGWLVEGLKSDPETCSVDLVTAAGAGGRVAALLESVADGGSSGRTASLFGRVAGHLRAGVERHAVAAMTGASPQDVARIADAIAAGPPSLPSSDDDDVESNRRKRPAVPSQSGVPAVSLPGGIVQEAPTRGAGMNWVERRRRLMEAPRMPGPVSYVASGATVPAVGSRPVLQESPATGQRALLNDLQGVGRAGFEPQTDMGRRLLEARELQAVSAVQPMGSVLDWIARRKAGRS